MTSSGDSRAGRGDCTLGGCKHTGRLAGAISGNEGFLFLGTDTACKLSGNIAFEIKHAVVDEPSETLMAVPSLYALIVT